MPDSRAPADDSCVPLLRAAAVRRLESRHADAGLMERAGDAVARLATTMAAQRAGPIVVLAGPGNNGGDGLVAARRLAERGLDVTVALLDGGERYRGDAAVAWRRLAGSRVAIHDDARPLLDEATLVVDALFGIGANRPPAGKAREWIEAVDVSEVPVLAVDVPSGVDADTGHAADVAVRADCTITFLADKPGLHTGDAVDHVGTIVVDPLGVDLRDGDFAAGTAGASNGPTLFPALFASRRLNSHKGTNGSALVVGGADGMVGAALMASRMALHGGAGRVYVKLLARDGPGYDVLFPELMLRDSIDDVEATAVAIGPGLGAGDDALALLARWLPASASLCIDADALNAIATNPALAAALRVRSTPAVLTPHPLEAARLLGTDTATVQRDRIGAAMTLARRHGAVVVLKGAGTIVAEPDGAWVVNTTGNPALATGGTGDVLCGLVAALLAQRLPPAEAARAAVWLHGRAADDLVAAGVGPIGVAATELIPAIRAALNGVRRRRGRA